MAGTLLKVTTMISKLQDKLDDVVNKVSDCTYLGEYNDSVTASKSVLPKKVHVPTEKKAANKVQTEKGKGE